MSGLLDGFEAFAPADIKPSALNVREESFIDGIHVAFAETHQDTPVQCLLVDSLWFNLLIHFVSNELNLLNELWPELGVVHLI